MYSINRISSPQLGYKSPYELLFFDPLSYTQLRVFGCLCYALTLRHNINKFDARDKNIFFFDIHMVLKDKNFLLLIYTLLLSLGMLFFMHMYFLTKMFV